MNTKTILALAATTLLTTSLLAAPGGSCKEGKNGASCKQEKNATSCKHGKMNKHNKSQSLVKMMKKLDLSKDQREKIRTIVKDSMKNRPNPNTAFSETKFDKKQFMKLAKEKRDTKLERRADMLEKVYAVLNDTQKKDFKTMLDMKAIKSKNMKRCAK